MTTETETRLKRAIDKIAAEHTPSQHRVHKILGLMTAVSYLQMNLPDVAEYATKVSGDISREAELMRLKHRAEKYRKTYEHNSRERINGK